MSFADAFLIVKGDDEKQEQTFLLNQLAHVNAIGLTNDKKFKPTNPFKNVEENNGYKKVSLAEREQTLKHLEEVFDTKIR